MNEFNIVEHPHRRLNILTGEWILVSPHRGNRPWQGQVEAIPLDTRPSYDETCYLCPGNKRVGGEENVKYENTFVFTNDFSALLNDTPMGEYAEEDLLIAQAEQGVCRVVCFSPRHDLTIAEMDIAGVKAVVDLWAEQYEELGSRDDINYVQIFENKGAAMGCSNPHPHGQIWAQKSIPSEPAQELVQMKNHYNQKGRSLLIDYLELELKHEKRIVCSNENFVALVPFWATWPFETLILPRRHVASLLDMTDVEKAGLADIVSQVTIRYDNLFKISFPYSAGLHQAPTDGEEHPEWDFHMHFYPPLLRSATVKKFMVGYEMLAGPQRDITAETSAALLRDLPALHYKYDSGYEGVE